MNIRLVLKKLRPSNKLDYNKWKTIESKRSALKLSVLKRSKNALNLKPNFSRKKRRLNYLLKP